jgi:hypothetical protein
MKIGVSYEGTSYDLVQATVYDDDYIRALHGVQVVDR